MRFRAGLLLGGFIGYVLGARAGRDRYHQIMAAYRQLRAHPAVAQLTDQAVGLMDAGRHAVAGSLSASSKGLRHTVDSNGKPDPRVP
ncbi:hypothetical protein BH23ACT5_BH23ACT5_24250 [soil metagenome]